MLGIFVTVGLTKSIFLFKVTVAALNFKNIIYYMIYCKNITRQILILGTFIGKSSFLNNSVVGKGLLIFICSNTDGIAPFFNLYICLLTNPF